MIDTELRITPVECRALGNGGKSRTVGGYGSVFDADSHVLPAVMAGKHAPPEAQSFVERVAPTFYDGDEAAGWPGDGNGVLSCYNHDPNQLLGTTRAKTLRLEKDRRGLYYSVDLPEHRSDVYELVARGDISGSSITFQVSRDVWDCIDGIARRTVESGTLLELGPVYSPAFPDTTVALRSLSRYVNAPMEDVEQYAKAGELRKLLTRTDRPQRTGINGRLALIRTEEMRPKPPRTHADRIVELTHMAMPTT